MIQLSKTQENIYSQLLDAVSRDDIVMLNALMRFGKTAVILHFVQQQEYKRVVVITDSPYLSYLKLLPRINYKENEQIFFFTTTQIERIINPDLIIIDDIEQFLPLKFNCKKIYMCGIMNDSFKQNIKTIVKYSYNDYLKDNNQPLLKIKKPSQKLPVIIRKKLDLMKKHLILVIGSKQQTYDKLTEFNQDYLLLYSDNYSNVSGLIQKSQKNIILCSQTLIKNISIPLCQVVIVVSSTDPIQCAFRGMMEYEGKQFSYVYFMKQKDEDTFIEYFKKEEVDPKVFE